MGSLSNIYLLTYNCIGALGWAISLFRIMSTKSLNEAYASAGDLVCLLQISALVEVIHGIVGIVPSGVVMPLMQWAGRTHFLLSIVKQIKQVQDSPSLLITFMAWSLSDVIRYSYHALNCVGSCPNWMTYLRYTAFIVLYPLGLFLGELWIMCQALPYIREENLYQNLFSFLPFGYYDFLRVFVVCYPFLWFRLYLHLFNQRRSKLGGRQHHQKKSR